MDTLWVQRKDKQFLVAQTGVGEIKKVHGVVAPIVGGKFVGCVPTDFSTYKVHDTLAECRVYVEALNALTTGDHDDDDE